MYGHRASELKHFWKVAEMAELGHGVMRSLQVDGESSGLLKKKGNTEAREMVQLETTVMRNSLLIRVTGIK